MIRYIDGDVFAGPERFLAHGCNAAGVMGAGVAKVVRQKYPMAYEFYRWEHYQSGLKLGQVYFIDCGSKVILNCITQQTYGRGQQVNYEAIESCMKQINDIANDQEVAMPMIGAGLGGGDWTKIEKIINDTATFKPVVYVYE